MPLPTDRDTSDSAADHAADHNTLHAFYNTHSGTSVPAKDFYPAFAYPPASPNAKDDEFSDRTGESGPVNGLNAKWSKHNLGTAGWLVLDDTKAPGALLFDIPSGQAGDQSIYQAVPAGDFTITARFSMAYMSDRQMWGLFIVDTSGNGVCMQADAPSGDVSRLRTASAWAQGSNINALVPDIGMPYQQGYPVNFSLRKASTTYYAAVTMGDRALAPALFEVNSGSQGFTPAYIGFGRLFGTGASKAVLDFFRVA